MIKYLARHDKCKKKKKIEEEEPDQSGFIGCSTWNLDKYEIKSLIVQGSWMGAGGPFYVSIVKFSFPQN